MFTDFLASIVSSEIPRVAFLIPVAGKAVPTPGHCFCFPLTLSGKNILLGIIVLKSMCSRHSIKERKRKNIFKA